MKNWKIPGIILILQILAMMLRWQTEKTTYTDDSMTKNEVVGTNPFTDKPITKLTVLDNSMTKVITNRWNGSVWEEKATTSQHTRTLIAAPWVELADSYSLTAVWYSLAGLDSAWLIFALLKKRNDGKKSFSSMEPASHL